MATPESAAALAWRAASRIHNRLNRQIEKLKIDSSNGTNVSQLDGLCEELAKLRMYCMQTIFLDFQYAVSENAELVLWQMHSFINTEYRRILGRLKHNPHVVERRKVEKSYIIFLRTAIEFYKGYIQRLSALFDVEELKRVAQGFRIEEAQIPARDRISPVPAPLKALVLTCCHSTLIRMGDLSRYRTQAKNRRSGRSDYSAALSCYSLAHDLVPDSGYAFHQIGIIHLEEGTPLDIAYDFYRAWATRSPHPNAKQNLEAHFKTVQTMSSTPSGRVPPPTAHDAFITWFVRLHALFYKANPVSSLHNELDQEVIHQLTMAFKDPVCAPLLFKMSLINIAAFCVASDRYSKADSEATTATASRSCQYILKFNARFISKLCEALEYEIKQAVQHRVEGATDPKLTAPTLLPPIQALLPILRTYCMWLGAHRQEMFSAAEALGEVLPSMVRSLATVVTVLAAESYSRDNLASCPYLLPEDLEIRGLKSFSNDRVPAECRSYCTEDGNLKPHRQTSLEVCLTSEEEFAARLLDTLRCAYNLAEDPAVPLTAQFIEGYLKFEYKAVEEKLQLPQDTTDPTPPTRGDGCNVDDDHNDMVSTSRQSTPAVHGQGDQPMITVSNSQQNSGSTLHSSSLSYGFIPATELSHADTNVVNMLSPFLDCPTPRSEQSEALPEEPSYGMHSATADEVARELLANFHPEQGADVGPVLDPWDPLIWNCKFPSPTPARPHVSTPALGNGTFPSHRTSNRSSRGSVPTADMLEDPFATPGSRPMISNGIPVGIQQPHRISNLPSPANIRASSSEESHRNQLLQAFVNPNVSRNSPSASWSQNAWGDPLLALQVPEPLRNTWEQQAPPGFMSSGASAFTNQSSLYQGTPANNMAYGMPTYGLSMTSHIQNPMMRQPQDSMRSQSQSGDEPYRENVPSSNAQLSGRHLQMDKAASSYDQAILSAAWQGKR